MTKIFTVTTIMCLFIIGTSIACDNTENENCILPCRNGGTCVGTKCECLDPYKGPQCQLCNEEAGYYKHPETYECTYWTDPCTQERQDYCSAVDWHCRCGYDQTGDFYSYCYSPWPGVECPKMSEYQE